MCECVCHSYGDTLLVIGFAFSSFSTFLAPLSGAATISMWFAHLLLFLSSSSSSSSSSSVSSSHLQAVKFAGS